MNPYLKDLQAFADLLAACNVIHESAVHDAEDYDGEETLCCIAKAHSRLMAEETAICESLKRERDEARAELRKASVEANTLATSIQKAEYPDAKDFELLGSVAGVISQIDNMYAGVRQQRDEERDQKNQWITAFIQKSKDLGHELATVIAQRDRLAEVINAATILIAAKGRHNTMLAYEGLRATLQSLTPNDQDQGHSPAKENL
jgi:hypothetical protein